MKKFFTAFVLVLALCLTSVPAFAADLTQDVSTGNTTVYHRVGNITDAHDPNDPTDDEIAGTYTVSIPAYIEAAAQEQVPAEQEVSAFDVLLPYGTKLLVYPPITAYCLFKRLFQSLQGFFGCTDRYH